jgi:hypothetical protein
MKLSSDEPNTKFLIYVSFIAFLLLVIVFPLSFLPKNINPGDVFFVKNHNVTTSPTLIIRKTENPTLSPTILKTENPTLSPTILKTENPTLSPTILKTENPTLSPTTLRTENPTSLKPTLLPTKSPTKNLMSTAAPTTNETLLQ